MWNKLWFQVLRGNCSKKGNSIRSVITWGDLCGLFVHQRHWRHKLVYNVIKYLTFVPSLHQLCSVMRGENTSGKRGHPDKTIQFDTAQFRLCGWLPWFREWDQSLACLRIPNPNKQEWMPCGFGRQMPTADSPYAHTMKESNELKLVSVQLFLRYK